MVKSFGTWLQGMQLRVQRARNRNAQVRREIDQQRFEDREALHAAGIYEPPPPIAPFG